MKNCVNCNAEIVDTAQFCPKCGHKQEVIPPVDNVDAAAGVTAEAEQIAAAPEVPRQEYTEPQSQAEISAPQQAYVQPQEQVNVLPQAQVYNPPQAQPYTPQQGQGYQPPQGQADQTPQGLGYQPQQGQGYQPPQGQVYQQQQGQADQPPQGQQPFPPQGSPYPQPAAPKAPPSQIAIDGKRYFNWLSKGMLGTKEPMHILFAAIIPFLTTLIYTLSSAPFYDWHAGGFFLVWFFSILFVAAIPAAAWLLKTYVFKEKVEFKNLFSEYASYFNIIFLYSFLVMIFVLAIGGVGPANLFYALYKGTLVFSLLAGVAAIVSKPETGQKTWLTLLIMGCIFVVLTFIIVAIEWYALTRWAMWGW